MKLNTNLAFLLKDLEYTVLQGSVEGEVTAVINDSRKVCPGCLFICIAGAVFDGHAYAGEVTEKGASVLIVEKPVEVPESVTVIQVPIVLDNNSLALAPKYWATMIPTPVEIPTKSTNNRFKRGVALPTAASALSPT